MGGGRQFEEGRQALGGDVLMRGEVVVGEDFPVRESAHGQAPAAVEADLVASVVGGLGALRHVDDELLHGRREARRGETAGAAEQSLPVVQKMGRWRLRRRPHRAGFLERQGPRQLSQVRFPFATMECEGATGIGFKRRAASSARMPRA